MQITFVTRLIHATFLKIRVQIAFHKSNSAVRQGSPTIIVLMRLPKGFPEAGETGGRGEAGGTGFLQEEAGPGLGGGDDSGGEGR